MLICFSNLFRTGCLAESRFTKIVSFIVRSGIFMTFKQMSFKKRENAEEGCSNFLTLHLFAQPDRWAFLRNANVWSANRVYSVQWTLSNLILCLYASVFDSKGLSS